MAPAVADRRILEILSERRHVSRRELGRLVGLRPLSLRRVLLRLRRCGQLAIVDHGRRRALDQWARSRR